MHLQCRLLDQKKVRYCNRCCQRWFYGCFLTFSGVWECIMKHAALKLPLSVFPASASPQQQQQQQDCNELSWAELRPRCCWPLCGQPAAVVPARWTPGSGWWGGGGWACVRSSNNQHSREAHSPLLLLFTTVYFLPLLTASALKTIMRRCWRSVEMDMISPASSKGWQRWNLCG